MNKPLPLPKIAPIKILQSISNTNTGKSQFSVDE